MDFKDYFSAQAKEYSRYRPKYPKELFEFISSLCKERKRAWDCATGNGQAATALAEYFDEVIATDASAQQIEHAEPNPRVTYRTAPAESSGLGSASCDLITVATAIHWIDTEKFYPEVRRILKPGGVIAVWTYGEDSITPEIDKAVAEYSFEFVGKYWPPENKKAWNFEALIEFPFKRIPAPEFKLIVRWSLKDYMNYLYTWSATQNYIKENGKNPVEMFYDKFRKVWGDENSLKEVTKPLQMKVGRV